LDFCTVFIFLIGLLFGCLTIVHFVLLLLWLVFTRVRSAYGALANNLVV